MRPFYLRAAIGGFCAWSILAPLSALADEAKDTLIVETILRLEDFDLSSSEKAQAAVTRYLKSNWGGERYLDLIRRFELKAEAPGVLKLALEKADDPIGVVAAKTLADLGASNLLAKTLHGKDATAAVRAAKAMSHVKNKESLAELTKALADKARPAKVRAAALAAIYGSSPDKHAKLLAKVKAGELAKDLRQTASELLMLSRDPKVREEAQNLFAVGESDLPALAELVKRKGDPGRGKKLFATKTCTVCHQAGGVGINFGPGLAEIGDKLSKEALYKAIIEPSSAISMGFEGWEITLKDGTPPLLGIVVEAEEDLTVTMIGGAKRTVEKSAIASKKKLKQSLMYPGLHRLMKTDELVDLVDYLSSLKKRQDPKSPKSGVN
ncbi:MAG: putative heme-binding domain-containing protein [Verrucomicrobiales bacterium]|jgi:putative heme-binding domain-containing protein